MQAFCDAPRFAVLMGPLLPSATTPARLPLKQAIKTLNQAIKIGNRCGGMVLGSSTVGNPYYFPTRKPPSWSRRRALLPPKHCQCKECAHPRQRPLDSLSGFRGYLTEGWFVRNTGIC